MVICQNDQKPKYLGAGFLLYKGHMIQTLVIYDTSDFCHRLNIYLISVCLIPSNFMKTN